MDCTWGSGGVTEKHVFRRYFNPECFDPDPIGLIFSHYPSKSEWQLVPTLLSETDFLSQPYLRLPFFKYNMQLITPKSTELSIEGDTLSVHFGGPPDLRISANLILEGVKQPIVLEGKKSDSAWVFELLLPQKGKHKLLVWAGRGILKHDLTTLLITKV